MKLLVVGATGRIGRRLVAGGLARGHDVTGTCRRPPARPADAPRLIAWDAADAAALERVLDGREAVLVAAPADAPLRRRPSHAATASAVVAAMQRCRVERLLWLSSVGTGAPDDPNLPPSFTRVVRPFVLAPYFRDLAGAEDTITKSGLAWTLVHLPLLTNGEALGRYRAAEGASLPGGTRISRADVADFLLKELERGRWVGRHVAVAY